MRDATVRKLARRTLPSWVRRGAVVLTTLVAVLIMAAGTASAIWSTSGNSTGPATTANFINPVLTAPSPSAGTVSLSWTASTGTGKPVGYYVTRTVGTTTVNVCGTPTATIAALSCSDAGVPNGTYSYVVTAISGSWTAASTAVIVVVAPTASKLVFTTQPSSTATSAIAFTTQPVVAIEDSSNNVITTNTSQVTLSLQTAAGATLTCTANPKAAVAGVVTYGGCAIDKVGSYKLVATLGSLTVTSSTTITVSAGAAAKLVYTSLASDTYAGGVFFTQPAVTIEDAAGNTVTTNSSSVTLAITPTTGGAALSCTANPKAAASGVATFAGCAINVARTYTLTATDGALTSATDSVTITSGPVGLVWSSNSATICNAPTGSQAALAYSGCLSGSFQVGKLTSKVALVDSSGTGSVNTGADLIVTISGVLASASPSTLTIPHGASVSSASTAYTPGLARFGPNTDTVTASSGSLATAKATHGV